MSTARAVFQGARDIIDPRGALERKKAEEDARRRAAEERMDLRWFLADPRGRRIASRLLARCHLLSSTFAQDQRLADRAEGRRDLATAWWGDLFAAAPDEALDLFRMDPSFQRAKDAGKA